MSRPRLAIVGTGIAGLSCGYFLRERFDLTFFEQADYPGGHTNTIDMTAHGEAVTFDTGFMVFNRVTYPNLCRFFAELAVPVKPTDMSFSVQHRPTGLEFSGSSLNHLFAQRGNLVRPRFWNLLYQVNRFNEDAVAALHEARWADTTLGDYVAERGYGDDFLDLYLVPMSSAVWSTPPDRMREFPALTLLRFFHNHGFLGLHTQHPWWTVTGGAREYVRRLRPMLGGCLRLNSPVVRVHRPAQGGATVTTQDGRTEHFDRVVLACHADQALRLLADADPEERRLGGVPLPAQPRHHSHRRVGHAPRAARLVVLELPRGGHARRRITAADDLLDEPPPGGERAGELLRLHQRRGGRAPGTHPAPDSLRASALQPGSHPGAAPAAGAEPPHGRAGLLCRQLFPPRLPRGRLHQRAGLRAGDCRRTILDLKPLNLSETVRVRRVSFPALTKSV